MRDELVTQRLEVDVPVEVLRDDDDVGHALAPHDLVGVVLVGPDEDDRPLVGGHEGAGCPAVLEVGGNPQAEDADEPVDGARAPRAGEDHGRGVVAPHRLADDPPRVLAQPGGLQAGPRALGVGVGVPG